MGNRASTPLAAAPASMQEIAQGTSKPWQRDHPQERFSETVIDHDSFYGTLRALYATKVLKTQLDQLRKQGSYDAFKLGWNPKYDIHRIHGGKCTMSSPPTLFWDADVGKWVEAACYHLASPAVEFSPHKRELESAVDELVNMIVKAQQSDGYIGTYFTVVDKAGRLKNLRDHHELYCCGHMLEAALAHHRYTGNRKFLNAMIKYVDLLMKTFGPGKSQLHGYGGHPELELAVLRLYSETKDPRHYAFGEYLVGARGKREQDLGNRAFFVWEAEQRKDPLYHAGAMGSIDDGTYHQSHAPLHEQDAILGHSVRALYLLTGAADLDGSFLDDARRLWADCVDNKMYPTGGVGSVPMIEGFSEIPHFLPNGVDEGGCYAETCASIACMMVSERLLSHEINGKVRDVMERCLLNNVLGGASLDGSQFYYDNRLATYGDEDASRSDWFDVCCCPPNLTRTMGMLGGYVWSAKTEDKTISLDVYLFVSGTLRKKLPNGAVATAQMTSEMPWKGRTTLKLDAPAGWKWEVMIPQPEYAVDFTIRHADATSSQQISSSNTGNVSGFACLSLRANSTISVSFDMPVRLISPHPTTHQDTLAVARGPIVYTAESFDNPQLDEQYPHFADIGLLETTDFEEVSMEIENIPMIGLISRGKVHALQTAGREEVGSTRVVDGKEQKAKTWTQTDCRLRLVPFFARANRGPNQRLRTMFTRVAESDVAQPPATPLSSQSADARFQAIYKHEWTWRQAQHLEQEEDAGGLVDYLPQVDEKTQQSRHDYWMEVLHKLKGIDPKELSSEEQANYGVFRAQIAVLVANQRFKEYQKPLNADTAFWSNLASTARDASFSRSQDYGKYISQLKQVPRYFDQQIDNMRAGAKRGFTPPRITLEGRDSSITSVTDVKSAEDTIYYEPFKTMPSGIPAAEQAHLRAEGSEAIRTAVMPAYCKLLAFFRQKYLPKAVEDLAAESLPDGKAYYAAKILEYTTTTLTPDEIHQIGVREVAQIHDEMVKTMKKSGFKGDLPAFLDFLRTDPQFYAKTAGELLREAAFICKEFDGVSSKFFGHLPRKRFAIRPVPDDLAPFYTSGRGGPGVYFVNTYDLPSRALYSLPALSLHEAAPGHAFQMPLVLEHKNLPPFRKTYISAYGEGWALYCEYLGTEMGIYHTPYDYFGMLSYQNWRAARLAVDTGLHAKGWTREQAQRYLNDNTALSAHEIETEVDRYIACPGQALSYYLGHLAILGARRKAEAALGERFNLAAFHDAVLETGSIPLPLLEKHIDEFIASGGVGPYPEDELSA